MCVSLKVEQKQRTWRGTPKQQQLYHVCFHAAGTCRCLHGPHDVFEGVGTVYAEISKETTKSPSEQVACVKYFMERISCADIELDTREWNANLYTTYITKGNIYLCETVWCFRSGPAGYIPSKQPSDDKRSHLVQHFSAWVENSFAFCLQISTETLRTAPVNTITAPTISIQFLWPG